MQGLNQTPTCTHVIARTSNWPYFALCVAIAVWQPRQADAVMPTAPVAAKAPSSVWSSSSTTRLSPPLDAVAAAGKYVSASTTTKTASVSLLEEDDVHRPDDVFNRTNLRTEYRQCVASSGADASAKHVCMVEEFHWQEERLRLAWGAIAIGPDSAFKDKLADEQHTYMSETYQTCHYDPLTKDQKQLIAAQPCLTKRYANRADVLEALIAN